MKSFLLLPALACSALAANPLFAGVGSSYAYGPGVQKNISSNLKDMLQKHYSKTYEYAPLATSGSKLPDIPKYQSPQLKNKSPELIFMLSGGNDLNYVTCLGYPTIPTDGTCTSPEPESKWRADFIAALDAIFSTVDNPTTVKLYIATYPVAIGPATNCSTSNPDCPLTSDQVDNAWTLYQDQVQFTVRALDAWRGNSSNSNFHTILIPMKLYSFPGHEIGTSDPWIQAKTGAAPWHPTDSGTKAIAGYIYSNFTGTG